MRDVTNPAYIAELDEFVESALNEMNAINTEWFMLTSQLDEERRKLTNLIENLSELLGEDVGWNQTGSEPFAEIQWIRHGVPDRKPLLSSVPDGAERLGIHPDTLRRLIKSGQVACVRIGNRMMVSELELRRIAEEGVA